MPCVDCCTTALVACQTAGKAVFTGARKDGSLVFTVTYPSGYTRFYRVWQSNRRGLRSNATRVHLQYIDAGMKRWRRSELSHKFVDKLKALSCEM